MKKWKLWSTAGITAAVALGGVAATLRTSSADTPEIVVYKRVECGCCGHWIDHVKAAGFRVSVRNRSDLIDIKARYAITPAVASCHTAVVDGYAVEGHVPADVIKRLLRERPGVTGIAVPGMPGGAPGMEGPVRERYNVLTFDRSGIIRIYATR
jgi:hypothetical protein